MPAFIRAIFTSIALAVVGVLCGCGGGEPKTVAKGKLLDNGKPFVLDMSKIPLPKGATAAPPGAGGGGLLRVTFIPTEGGGEHYQAIVNAETGEFSVPGADGKGIKLGKYKVAVTASAGGSGDLFGGKFTSEKTTITREVKEGEEIVIDVARP